jgi:hypothetical protein
LADGLLGDVQVVRGAGEAAPFRDGGESSELAQVEAGVGDHGPRSCMRAPAGVHNGCLLTDNKPRLLPDVRATTVQQELDQIF